MIDLDRVVSDLKEDEGFVSCAYEDHLGFLTIGYGTLIDRRKGGGITQDEATMLLRNRLTAILGRLDKLRPGWRTLKGRAPDAIANMAYQLGADGVHAFSDMWAALFRGDYKAAAKEALDSKWAKQTPDRAKCMAELIEGA